MGVDEYLSLNSSSDWRPSANLCNPNLIFYLPPATKQQAPFLVPTTGSTQQVLGGIGVEGGGKVDEVTALLRECPHHI